mmetsp:Transcript_22234/g.16664  ORF Transcript_22234/g.16664 Transcript_22234/m.16664 type:complete len:191 (+) Transcript_22234:1417-1989(+)
MKPKNGINYLISKGFIAKEPREQMVADIVKFLFTTPTLNKTQIGDYLGEDMEVNKQVLYTHIDSFNFVNVSYIEAMKRVLATFRMPGEGQKVDRVMEKFGEKFCKDNQDTFGSSECVYLLSYAVMMLQTSLHNPQAQKSRMSVEDFVKMTKGINNGKDLEFEFLKGIYDHIEKEPFSLVEDDDARLKLEA